MQTDTLAELSAQSITTETDASPIVYQSDDWPVIFGLRLAPFTFEQTLAEADRLIQGAARRTSLPRTCTMQVSWRAIAVCSSTMRKQLFSLPTACRSSGPHALKVRHCPSVWPVRT